MNGIIIVILLLYVEICSQYGEKTVRYTSACPYAVLPFSLTRRIKGIERSKKRLEKEKTQRESRDPSPQPHLARTRSIRA